jgi:hypothetical protein
MKFLLDLGISNETLEKIQTNNSDQLMLDAEWNIERVVSSIEYLREIGITNIDKLLINRFDIVLRGKEDLEETFKNLDQDKIVEMINKDIKYVYYLDRY